MKQILNVIKAPRHFEGRYPEEIVDKEMPNVEFKFSRKIRPKNKEEKGVTLTVTFHPSLNGLSIIIRGNFTYFT